MEPEDKFKEAVDRSSSITQKPTNEELLQLYALYKQSTEGDVEGERPGGFDFKGAAKYDAWLDLRGREKRECMTKYIELVNSLIEKYNG
jgi:acyl-CoA-binding protein